MLILGQKSYFLGPTVLTTKLIFSYRTMLGDFVVWMNIQPECQLNRNFRPSSISTSHQKVLYCNFCDWLRLYNLFVTSKNETTNFPIHQFSNLMCCIKAREPFKPPLLMMYYFLLAFKSRIRDVCSPNLHYVGSFFGWTRTRTQTERQTAKSK